MKYLRQFGIILAVTFIAEIAKYLIPLPIPASIYGMLFMLAALKTGLVPLNSVKEAGNYLIEIMPLMFIPAAVGLLAALDELRDVWIPVAVMIVIVTVIVMGVTGRVTQLMIRMERRKEHE
jgi:holin-like protein